jgi:hypothetical protein
MEKFDKAVLEGGKSRFKTYTAKSSKTGEVIFPQSLPEF